MPMTFVTSVFGMTNMPAEHFFRYFAITMAAVCIPFFGLIAFLNTTAGMDFWLNKWQRLRAWVVRKPRPESMLGDTLTTLRKFTNDGTFIPLLTMLDGPLTDCRKFEASQIVLGISSRGSEKNTNQTNRELHCFEPSS